MVLQDLQWSSCSKRQSRLAVKLSYSTQIRPSLLYAIYNCVCNNETSYTLDTVLENVGSCTQLDFYRDLFCNKILGGSVRIVRVMQFACKEIMDLFEVIITNSMDLIGMWEKYRDN